MRACGVLMPISSIPSRFGIGCFSKEAYEFVDQLIAAGQKYWQILPLGPTGYGDSPYQSFSTFAGNPYFIDLEGLVKEGLLKEWEIQSCDWGHDPARVDYGKIYENRFRVLRHAYEVWKQQGRQHEQEFGEFVRGCGFWLEDYCLYMAVKNHFQGKCWAQWPQEIKDRSPKAVQEYRELLSDELGFYRFQQYWFSRQWKALKTYANQNGVEIIGDLPIYVAFDSADTWANPLLFQFDEENTPVAVSGCPPDAFSSTGQLWGNPLYSWEYHRTTEFTWWTQRVAYNYEMYDVIRIDHFRGFDEYYSIPYGDATAEFGHWEKGPGLELFRVLQEKLGKLRIIAEDLGFLTESVLQLVKDTGFPGMKVLQFAFDGSEDSSYLPHKYEKNCVVYTGTCDNNTTKGWYESLYGHDLDFARAYTNCEGKPVDACVWDLIRTAIASVSDLAIIPIQDYLCLGSEARVNLPGSFGNNWQWRMRPGQLSRETIERMRRLAKIYGRI